MMKVTFALGGRDDPHRLHEYLAQTLPAYAKQLLNEVISRVDTLHRFPQMSRTLPEARETNCYGSYWEAVIASLASNRRVTGF